MDIGFALILMGWAIGGASPGPATLAIAGAAMQHGRGAGLAVATGVICGSAMWGIAAAMGLSALMLAHGWTVEVMRYVGAVYLLYLAFKAARSAIRNTPLVPAGAKRGTLGTHYRRGLLIHLTNPKAIFGWGAMFAIVVAPGASSSVIWTTFAALIMVSMTVFWSYGVIFSSAVAVRGYERLRRWFEATFAILFGFAGLKILTYRVTP